MYSGHNRFEPTDSTTISASTLTTPSIAILDGKVVNIIGKADGVPIYKIKQGGYLYNIQSNQLIFEEQRIYYQGKKWKIKRILINGDVTIYRKNYCITIQDLQHITRKPAPVPSCYEICNVYVVFEGTIVSSYKFKGVPSLKRIVRESVGLVYDNIVLVTKFPWDSIERLVRVNHNNQWSDFKIMDSDTVNIMIKLLGWI